MRGALEVLSESPELVVLMLLLSVLAVFITYLVLLVRSGKRFRELIFLLERLQFSQSSITRLRSSRTVRDLLDGISTVLEKEVEGLRRKLLIQSEATRNLSHDLGGPLTAIRGYTETLLEKNSSLDEQSRSKFLETIDRNARQLDSMVQEFLEISKLEAREMKIVSSQIDPLQLGTFIYERYIPLARKQGVEFEINNSRLRPSVLIQGEFNLLSRALSNLVQNSIYYTPQGGKVSLEMLSIDKGVRFVVRDTGIGIASDEHIKIFEPFYRVNRDRSRSTGGMGLGLSVVKRILELHYSSPVVVSEPGKGTQVSFDIK